MNFKRLLKDIKNIESWIISYILILLVSGFSSFIIQMLNAGLPLYCEDVGLGLTKSGIISGFYSFALLASRPFVGKWTDEKGKKKISFLGLILLIISFGLMAITSSFSLFSIYQLIQGFAYAALSTAIAALLLDYLPEDRVKNGIALFAVSKSLAISLGSSFVVSFCEKYGSKNVFLCCFIFMILTLLVFLFIKKNNINTGNEYNDSKEVKEEFFGLNKYVEVSKLPICLIQFIFTFSLTLGTCYLPTYAKEIGVAGIGIYYTISAITMCLSRTIFAKFLDHLNTKKSFIIGMIIASITTFLIIISNKLIYFILISIPNAISICMINPLLNYKATTNISENRTGVASATYYASVDLGSGLGSMIWGILIPIIGYYYSFIFATLLLIFALIFGILKLIKEV